MSSTYRQETVPNRLPTGLEGTNIPTDEFVPSCGIEDVDQAMFDLFDRRLQMEVVRDGAIVKVPVIFAAGETVYRRALVEDLGDDVI